MLSILVVTRHYGISSGYVWAFPDLGSVSGLLKIRETSGP